jgi:hypothetical protein
MPILDFSSAIFAISLRTSWLKAPRSLKSEQHRLFAGCGALSEPVWLRALDSVVPVSLHDDSRVTYDEIAVA